MAPLLALRSSVLALALATLPASSRDGLPSLELATADIDGTGGAKLHAAEHNHHHHQHYHRRAPSARLMRSHHALQEEADKLSEASFAEAPPTVDTEPADDATATDPDAPAPGPAPPAPNDVIDASYSDAKSTGIEVCQGKGLSESDCSDIPCCRYADNECWSSVGDGLCAAALENAPTSGEAEKITVPATADASNGPDAPEKAVDKCDYGPAQAGTYDISRKANLEILRASSAKLCQQACCANPRCSVFVFNKKRTSCQLLDNTVDIETYAAGDDFVSAVKAGAVERSATGKSSVSVNVMIGSSEMEQKCVDAPAGQQVVCDADAASSRKRLNTGQQNDGIRFRVSVGDDGKKVCVVRTDATKGWDMGLSIKCREAAGTIGAMGPASGADAEAAARDANVGGARFFTLKVTKDTQRMIRICEVKLFNAEMENIASKAMVSFDQTPKSQMSKQEDRLTDHKLFSSAQQDEDMACVTWDKKAAGKKLVTFEFSDAQVITAARIYATTKSEFGEKAEVLATSSPKMSSWKIILSTLPSQGMTLEFDGQGGGLMIPDGGNPACPTCMEEEGFPAAPNVPPFMSKANAAAAAGAAGGAAGAASYELAGPRGAQGEPGRDGKTPKLIENNSNLNLILASFVVNALFAAFCMCKFSRDLAAKSAKSASGRSRGGSMDESKKGKVEKDAGKGRKSPASSSASAAAPKGADESSSKGQFAGGTAVDEGDEEY